MSHLLVIESLDESKRNILSGEWETHELHTGGVEEEGEGAGELAEVPVTSGQG